MSQMRNRTLANQAESLSYPTFLRDAAGSVTAAILMARLDFWFSRYPNGFYKFLEPCEHPDYKKGDSWTEELWYSVDEFRSAFDKIGIRYSSKTQFEQSEDKFAGQMYASYFDKQKRLTHYFRNHKMVDVLLDGLSQNPPARQSTVDGQSQSLEMDNPNLHRSGKPIPLYKEHDYLSTEDIQTKRESAAHGSAAAPISSDNTMTPSMDSSFLPQTDTARPKTPTKKLHTTLPAGFSVDESMRQWATDNHITVDIDRETEKFRDYAISRNKTYVDWAAAWRNWIRNSMDYAAKNPRQEMKYNKKEYIVSDEKRQRLAAAYQAECDHAAAVRLNGNTLKPQRMGYTGRSIGEIVSEITAAGGSVL